MRVPYDNSSLIATRMETSEFEEEEEVVEDVEPVESGIHMSVCAHMGRLGIAIFDSVSQEVQALQASRGLSRIDGYSARSTAFPNPGA